MRVRRFKDEDRSMLKDWLLGHLLSANLLSELPAIGMIAEDEEGPVAAGFLRTIEACSYAMLDGLIANPRSNGKRRYHALNFVTKALLEMASLLKMKSIFGLSRDSSTLKRSQLHGFQRLPQQVIVKGLI